MNMQKVKRIKRELLYVIKKHENDKLQTFETSISGMAKDCLNAINWLVDVVEMVESAYHEK